MMTRRHFQAVARALSRTAPPDPELAELARWCRVVEELADTFGGENPRFDRERFLMAAGHPEHRRARA